MTVGAGITRHQSDVTVLDLTQRTTPEEMKELGDYLRAAAARPLWHKERIIADIEQRLRKLKAALPSDHDDLDFRPHDDFGWYYCELIRLDRIVRNAITEKDAARAALFAEDFGELHREMQIKEVWERDALAGRESFKGAQAGGQARGQSDQILDRRARFFRAHDDAVDRVGATIARQRAAKEAGYSDDHARRLLKQR